MSGPARLGPVRLSSARFGSARIGSALTLLIVLGGRPGGGHLLDDPPRLLGGLERAQLLLLMPHPVRREAPVVLPLLGRGRVRGRGRGGSRGGVWGGVRGWSRGGGWKEPNNRNKSTVLDNKGLSRTDAPCPFTTGLPNLCPGDLLPCSFSLQP